MWKKGTLFAGVLDVERAMFNLHRKGVPLPALREKAEEYQKLNHITEEQAHKIIRFLEAQKSVDRMLNDTGSPDDGDTTVPGLTHRLSPEQMRAELADREAKMQAGTQADGVSDQWRVYQYIIDPIQRGEYFRLAGPPEKICEKKTAEEK